MILFVSPRLAGPLSIALSGLLRWYFPSDVSQRRVLLNLQAELTKVAKGGHETTPFDPAEISAQAGAMVPLVVTFEVAASMLACSSRTIARRVRTGDLEAMGAGPSARVTVRSLEAFVTRATTTSRDEVA